MLIADLVTVVSFHSQAVRCLLSVCPRTATTPAQGHLTASSKALSSHSTADSTTQTDHLESRVP